MAQTIDAVDGAVSAAAEPAVLHQLTTDQQRALRLFQLVSRRQPDADEAEWIKDQGGSYPIFRLNFLLKHVDRVTQARLEAHFANFIQKRKTTDHYSRSRVAHNLEVLRLNLNEVQRKIDNMQSVILELMRHAERVNLALEQYSAVQSELSRLTRRLDQCVSVMSHDRSWDGEDVRQQPTGNLPG